ncbi:MAG: deoxyuridine 5'-triphosphate nucleotidohydrolase [Candidatus Pacearchaeota archaeon]
MNNILKISYQNTYVEKLYTENAGIKTEKSSGFDLLVVEPVYLCESIPFQLVSLGVVIKPPEGFHSILLPRSSTFKKFNLLQVNSLGLIDEDYCGALDIWKIPVLFVPSPTMREIHLLPGTRICQFFIQPKYSFSVEKFDPSIESRGGFGSTGV